MSVQTQNSEMIDLLRPTFQARREPNFAIANMMSTFQMLPELRGLWPFSSINETGSALDLSGQGRILTNNGTIPRLVSGLWPYCTFDGATQYWSRADEAGLDITGALSLCGWFYIGNLAGTRSMISKYNVAAQRAYVLLYSASTLALEFRVSPDGVNNVTATSAVTPFTGQWFFAGGRYTPGVEVTIFISNPSTGLLVKTVQAVGVPAAAFNSSAPLLIGGINATSASLLGRCGICAIGAAAWSDVIFNNLYEQSRAALGL